MGKKGRLYKKGRLFCVIFYGTISVAEEACQQNILNKVGLYINIMAMSGPNSCL